MSLALGAGWDARIVADGIELAGEFRTIRIRCSGGVAFRLQMSFNNRLPTAALVADEHAVMATLRRERAVVETSDRLPRHSRTSAYFAARGADSAGLGSLQRARAVVLGVGGTGCVAVEQLVGAGVERFVLIDSDVVDISNFNRQFLFSESDLGRPKVDAVSDWILSRCSTADVETTRLPLEISTLRQVLWGRLRPGDAVFVAADRPWPDLPLELLRGCASRGVPVIFSSVGVEKGFVSPILGAPKSVSFHEAVSCRSSEAHASGVPLLASSGTTNGLIATMAAERLIAHLAGFLPQEGYENSLVFDMRLPGHPLVATVERVRL